MAEQRKDREPWSPRIEKQPLFTNSADFERGLGEASNPPDITTDEGQEEDEAEKGSPLMPNTLKPGK